MLRAYLIDIFPGELKRSLRSTRGALALVIRRDLFRRFNWGDGDCAERGRIVARTGSKNRHAPGRTKPRRYIGWSAGLAKLRFRISRGQGGQSRPFEVIGVEMIVTGYDFLF